MKRIIALFLIMSNYLSLSAMNEFPYPLSQARATLAQTLAGTQQRLNSLIGIEKANSENLTRISRNNEESYTDSMLPSKITIPCTDGTITIPQNIWKKCHLFKDSIIATSDQPTPFAFDAVQKFPKKLLADLFLCIAKPDYAYKISAKSYDQLLEAAAYFGAPRSTVSKLSDSKRNSCLNAIKQMLGNNSNSTKFTNLAIQDLKHIDEFILHFYSLHDKLLESLSGIEKLSKELTILDLSNNYLTVLDVDDLVKKFPKLNKLNASNNKIKEIKISQLPNNFNLTVKNNDIKKINLKHRLFAPENSHLNIENNQLEDSELAKLKEQLLPGYWQKVRERMASQIKSSILALTAVPNALNNHIISNNLGFWGWLSLYIVRNNELPPANHIFFSLTIPILCQPIINQIRNLALATATGAANPIATALIVDSASSWLQSKVTNFIVDHTRNNIFSAIIDPKLHSLYGTPLLMIYFNALSAIMASPLLTNKLTNWNTTQYAFKPSKVITENQKPKQKTQTKKLDELD